VPLGIKFVLKGEAFRNITNSNDNKTYSACLTVYRSDQGPNDWYQKFKGTIQVILQKYTGELDATCLGIKLSFLWGFRHLFFELELEYLHKSIIIGIACKLDPHTSVIKLIESANLISDLEVTKIDDHKQS
jgi:hypothetical protein